MTKIKRQYVILFFLFIFFLVGAFLWIRINKSIQQEQAINARAANPITPPYIPGNILYKSKSTIPTLAEIRSVTGLADANIKQLYKNIYLVQSKALLSQYTALSRSDKEKSVTKATDQVHSSVITKLQKFSKIENASLDKTYLATSTPNDPLFNEQPNTKLIGLPEAWDTAISAQPVVVAVIDSGIDYNHPDIKNRMWKNPNETLNNIDDDKNGLVDDIYGYFGPEYTNALDKLGHGSHVAGIIAGEINNNTGIAGSCINCKVMALKVANNDTIYFRESSIISALAYVIAHPEVRVINHSYGGTSSQYISELLSDLNNRGVISVAAAGNNGSSLVTYPARYTEKNLVFSIAATDNDDVKAGFSNYGPTDTSIDFTAPGVDIYSLSANTSSYIKMSGTSMAAPHVSGVIGMMLGVKPNLTYQQIKNIFAATSERIDNQNPKYMNMLGYGRIYASRAVLLAKYGVIPASPMPTVTPSPTHTPTPTPTVNPQQRAPDLIPQNIYTDPPRPIGGGNINSLTIQISNSSATALSPTTLNIHAAIKSRTSVNNQWVYLCHLDQSYSNFALAANQTTTIQFNGNNTLANNYFCNRWEYGVEYVIEVTADSTNTITELLESNNTVTTSFYPANPAYLTPTPPFNFTQ